MMFVGILIGLCIGGLAAASKTPTKTKPATWAALAGAIVFALAKVSEYGETGAGLAVAAPALEASLIGAIWCYLWGLLGSVIGRKMAKPKERGVTGLPPGEEAWVAKFRVDQNEIWRVRRTTKGQKSDWTGEYATSQDALNAVKEQVFGKSDLSAVSTEPTGEAGKGTTA